MNIEHKLFLLQIILNKKNPLNLPYVPLPYKSSFIL